MISAMIDSSAISITLRSLVDQKRRIVTMILYEKNNSHIIQAEREVSAMKENTSQKTTSAADHMEYALYAFGGLGMELLLLMIETNLYGHASGTWSVIKYVIHWTITCFIWGCFGLLLCRQLPVISPTNIKKKNLISAVILIAVSVIYTSLVWKGWKPMIEFSNLGVVKFLVQYLYYAFECWLMVLIIAHGQTAFEVWFCHIKRIPFGGILLAVTWGLIHVFTQGTSTGIYTMIQALLYGSVYMVLDQDYKLSYVAVTLMFML